jgi:hypothetical protein
VLLDLVEARFPGVRAEVVARDEGGCGLDPTTVGDGERRGGLHLDAQDALGGVPLDLRSRLPERRVDRPRRARQNRLAPAVQPLDEFLGQVAGRSRGQGGRAVVIRGALVTERLGRDQDVRRVDVGVEHARVATERERPDAPVCERLHDHRRRGRADAEPAGDADPPVGRVEAVEGTAVEGGPEFPTAPGLDQVLEERVVETDDHAGGTVVGGHPPLAGVRRLAFGRENRFAVVLLPVERRGRTGRDAR